MTRKMNRVIEEQLKKCKNVTIPNIEKDQTVIFIPRSTKISTDNIKLDHNYIIEVDNFILSLTNSNSTLVSNWNSGQVVKSSHLKVSLNRIMNNMYQFDGIGFDIETGKDKQDFYSCLWLPKDHFKIIKEITY